MKAKHLLLFLLQWAFLTGCDFNINDGPGPKMSSSVDESQQHGTFICAYKLKLDTLQGIRIQTIFAERKFYREQGLWEKKVINCCESQLVMVSSTQPFSTQSAGYGVNWKIAGFITPSPFASIIYRDYKGVLFPDSIPIKIVAIKGKDSTQIIQRLTLYKTTDK
jgi:hypothetical protein